MNGRLRNLVLCAAVAGCTQGTSTQAPLPSSASPVPSLAALPSPAVVPTAPPLSPRLVAYSSGGTSVVNVDGTHAHLLLAGAFPVAWSSDGFRLLVRSSSGYAFTDAAGSPPDRYFELACPDGGGGDALDLTFCRGISGVALSPDGTRLAYVFSEGTHDQSNPIITSAIAVLDLTSGAVVTLDSTRTTRPVDGCGADADHGENLGVIWSPDGARLGFTRDSLGPSRNGDCDTAVHSVGADGGDLRSMSPSPGVGGSFAGWSPDGSMMAIVSRDGTYVGDANGVNLHRVSGEYAHGWTRTGGFVFLRWTVKSENSRAQRGDLWVMDANGGNATQLEATIPALTAAGCIVCPYPIVQPDGGIDPLVAHESPAFEQFWMASLLWQPSSQP